MNQSSILFFCLCAHFATKKVESNLLSLGKMLYFVVSAATELLCSIYQSNSRLQQLFFLSSFFFLSFFLLRHKVHLTLCFSQTNENGRILVEMEAFLCSVWLQAINIISRNFQSVGCWKAKVLCNDQLMASGTYFLSLVIIKVKRWK